MFGYITGGLVPLLIFTGGIAFAVRLRGFYLLKPFSTVKYMLSGRTGSGISPFRAAMMALAGTLGVGNIVGVGSAIAIGGFGSVFWMLVSAVAAMSLKYAEVTLALKHRRYDAATGEFYGGAQYCITDFFKGIGKLWAGKITAVLFVLFCLLNSFTMGCVIQVNAVSHVLDGLFGIPTVCVGSVFAVISSVCIFGGAKRVSMLTSKIVPLMTFGFFAVSLAAIFGNLRETLAAVRQITADAFRFRSVGGGIFGYAISAGCMRGLLSNEAGCGTAPMAHASADTDSPERQGLWGIFEVFADTVVLCTVTALVVILGWDSAEAYLQNPIMMVVAAYSGLIGKWAGGFLAAAVLLFGFSTVICWGQYGMQCVRFLFGRHSRIFRVIFMLAFGVTAFMGCIAAPNSIWGIADFALAGMTLINVPVLWLMRREVSLPNLHSR